MNDAFAEALRGASRHSGQHGTGDDEKMEPLLGTYGRRIQGLP
jgi:hypothetical protein